MTESPSPTELRRLLAEARDIERWLKAETVQNADEADRHVADLITRLADRLDAQAREVEGLREALERVTNHLDGWAADRPLERISETDAAIFCARSALGK